MLMPFLLFAIVLLVEFFQNKAIRDIQNDNNIIKLNMMFKFLGYIVMLVSHVLGAIFFFLDNIGVSIVLFFFGCIGIALILGYHGYVIYYDEKQITYRKFYGKFKIIKYKDIIAVDRGLDLYIRTATSTLRIANYTTNIEKFYIFVKEKTKSNNRSKKKACRPKVRKFSESIERSGEMIFGFILFILVGLIGAYISLISYWNGNVRESDHAICIAFIVAYLLIPSLTTAVTVFVVKRAHASTICKKIAKWLVKESYLKK